MRLKHKTRTSKDFPKESGPEKIRFAMDSEGNITSVWTHKVGWCSLKHVNPYYLYNLEKQLGEQYGTESRGYKAVMAEIHRRVESGVIYPNKELPAA